MSQSDVFVLTQEELENAISSKIEEFEKEQNEIDKQIAIICDSNQVVSTFATICFYRENQLNWSIPIDHPHFKDLIGAIFEIYPVGGNFGGGEFFVDFKIEDVLIKFRKLKSDDLPRNDFKNVPIPDELLDELETFSF